jgi:hypothetical protein
MFGAAFVELLEEVEQRCGLSGVDELLIAADLAEAAFTAFQSYDDDAFERLLDASCSLLERSRDDILEVLGGRLIERIMTADAAYFVQLTDPADLLLRVPVVHHAWFRAIHPEGAPPRIMATPTGNGEVRISYVSDRPLVRMTSGAAHAIGRRLGHPTHITWHDPIINPRAASFTVRYQPRHLSVER